LERYLEAAPFAWLSQIVLATQTERDAEAQRLSAYAKGLRLHRTGKTTEAQQVLQEATTAGPELAGVRLTPPEFSTPTATEPVTMAVFLKNGDVVNHLWSEFEKRYGLRREFVAPDIIAHAGSLGGRSVRLLTLVSPSFEIGKPSRWDTELEKAAI